MEWGGGEAGVVNRGGASKNARALDHIWTRGLPTGDTAGESAMGGDDIAG